MGVSRQRRTQGRGVSIQLVFLASRKAWVEI